MLLNGVGVLASRHPPVCACVVNGSGQGFAGSFDIRASTLLAAKHRRASPNAMVENDYSLSRSCVDIF